jgi:hypothetical protein
LLVVEVVTITDLVVEVLEVIGHRFLESHRVVEPQLNHPYTLTPQKII